MLASGQIEKLDHKRLTVHWSPSNCQKVSSVNFKQQAIRLLMTWLSKKRYLSIGENYNRLGCHKVVQLLLLCR